MADLIDRQAKLYAIDVLKRNYPSTCFEDLCKAVDIAIKALSAQPEQQWIPCSTDFPKKNGDYIVTTHSGQLARYIFNKGTSEEYWARCVTAWMPLPEPYKGEQNARHNL